MLFHEPANPGLADNVSLPPASQWRLGFEQGRRLEGAAHAELYQMLLAWFQHEILGLLCGLLFPASHLSQAAARLLRRSAHGGFAATTCNIASARATRFTSRAPARLIPVIEYR